MTFHVEVKLPVLMMGISGEYSRYKKPTGLENLVLTAIGTLELRSDTWAEFFQRLAIPERMSSLFGKVVTQLYDNGVITTSYFDLDSRIDEISFTDTGKDLFEQGRIKQDPKHFVTDVYYLPFEIPSKRLSFEVKLGSDDGFMRERFVDINCSMGDVKKFIADNKKHIKADKEDEILSVDEDREPQIMCMKNYVDLTFDDTSGDFAIDSVVDHNFIKRYFTAEDLIGNGEFFKGGDSIEVKTFADVPDEWESYRYHLIKDFKYKGKLQLFNPSVCRMRDAKGMDSLKYHFVDITGKDIGRGYLFVKKEVAVSGLNGGKEAMMMISRPLSASEISEIFKRYVASIDTSDYEGVRAILSLSDISDDPLYAHDVVLKHLSTVTDMAGSISMLNKDKEWKKLDLPNIVEESVCMRNMSVEEIVSVIGSSGIQLSCERIATRFVNGEPVDNMRVADNLFGICKKKDMLVKRLNIGNEMAEFILAGRSAVFKSKEFVALNEASRSFIALKEMFAVTDMGTYDSSKALELDPGIVSGKYDIFCKSMKIIDPYICGTDKAVELAEYENLFQNLTGIYSEEVPLEKLTGPWFGIGIRRKIENILRKKLNSKDDLDKLIERAHDLKYISDDQMEFLTRMRKYGNSCAHQEAVEHLDPKTKKKWVDIISGLQKQMDKGVKNE